MAIGKIGGVAALIRKSSSVIAYLLFASVANLAAYSPLDGLYPMYMSMSIGIQANPRKRIT